MRVSKSSAIHAAQISTLANDILQDIVIAELKMLVLELEDGKKKVIMDQALQQHLLNSTHQLHKRVMAMKHTISPSGEIIEIEALNELRVMFGKSKEEIGKLIKPIIKKEVAPSRPVSCGGSMAQSIARDHATPSAAPKTAGKTTEPESFKRPNTLATADGKRRKLAHEEAHTTVHRRQPPPLRVATWRLKFKQPYELHLTVSTELPAVAARPHLA